jgi:hypothetical protein
VDDHLGLGLGHGTGDRVGIERVGHDRPGTEGPEHVGLGRRPGHADHVVAGGGELGTSWVPIAPVAPATNTFMGASFPIHLRADTSRDKIALLPVTQGPSRLSNWAPLGTTPPL